MQVTETLSEGLKREFQVEVPAADLEARVSERLGELKDRVQLRGFRPGKVPVAHLKRIYGKAVMAETIEAVIRELNAKIVSDRGLKLAHGAEGHDPERGDRGREDHRGQVRSRLHGGARDPAEDRARRFQGHQARAAGRRGHRRRGRRSARARSPSRTGRSPPKARAPRPRTATASSSISPARSTARRSRAAPAATSASMSAPAPSSRASRISSSAWRRARRARSR